MRAIVRKICEAFESILPMTFGSFILFLIIGYFLYIVGNTTYANYQSNKDVAKEEAVVEELEEELRYAEYQINYYQTSSFKEKEAREKLGYKAPGENVISLPADAPESSEETVPGDESVKIKTPNYRLWWLYFFG